MAIKIGPLRIRSNPFKWVRKNLFGGKAITGGNVLVLAGEKLGLEGEPEAIAAQLIYSFNRGDITIKDITDVFEDEARKALADALIQWKEDAGKLLKALPV